MRPGQLAVAAAGGAGVSLLLVAAARLLRCWGRELADAAVTDERRRLARELHDGLAQELALIVSQGERLAGLPDAPAEARTLASSGRRALDESRRLLGALLRPQEPLDVALAREAEHLAARTGLAVRLDLAPGLHATPEVQDALLRIAGEALWNACRHARADKVTVELGREEGRLALRVIDDGVGFDPRSGRADGFGLVSMRERAAAVGASLRIDSRRGGGTTVAVLLP